MKKIWFLIIPLFYFSCEQLVGNTKDATAFIPKDFQKIYKINNIQDFELFAEKNSFSESILEIENDSILKILDYLSPNSPLYIVQTDQAKRNFIFLSNYHNKILKKDTSQVKSNKVYRSKFDSNFKYIIKDSVFISGLNSELIKNLDAEKQVRLNRLINSTDVNKPFSVIQKKPTDKFEFLFDTFKNSNDPIADFGLIDIASIEDDLVYNGVLNYNDSLITPLSFLKNQQAQVLEIPKVVNQNIGNLNIITYNDSNSFTDNKIAQNELLSLSNQVGVSNSQNGTLFYLHAYDENLIQSEFESNEIEETFKGINIFSIADKTQFKDIFSDVFSVNAITFGFVYESFFIGSDSIGLLKESITAILNGSTLEKFQPYQKTKAQLSNVCSLFFYKNNDDLKKSLGTNLSDFPSNIIQITTEKNIAHINGIFSKQKPQSITGGIEEFRNLSFKNGLRSKLYDLKDIKKRQNYICVQDVNNHLYLVNENGSVLFDIPLKQTIIGAPKILSNKNTDTKIAFSTESSLYLVNTKGENQKGFPKHFKDKITQPVSVFNYDNDRNFRIVITQNNEFLMYDQKGKQIKGFKPKKTKSAISNSPKHFRISGNDYIVFSQGERLEILNRKGQTRIPIKTPIQFSSNDIYNYKNKFTTTNDLGQLIQINTNGKVTTKNLNLSENHKMTSTLNTLVTLDDNMLKIKSNTIEMPYGEYTDPEIFYLKDKIYITITDKQEQKVYLFDSQGKSISNFPVYGTSDAKLQYNENKKHLQLVTKSDDKNILFYSIN